MFRFRWHQTKTFLFWQKHKLTRDHQERIELERNNETNKLIFIFIPCYLTENR